ncbi:MAG: beta-galactosidase trimerization domain-containing protein [bacterium]|nr:beta-galactosidase trimerization domain-containing protein [bacterium]
MEEFKLRRRRLFFDWHMPDFLPEVKLDTDYFIDKAVEIGSESIDFMGRSAFGNCLYPSKAGRSNKAIPGDGDIFGKVCRAAKARGLEFIAYFNMTLNDALAAEHPDWLQVDKDGNPANFENYATFCLNSPYRELSYRHIEEIALQFEVDGFNLDMQYFHPYGCFCKWCKAAFKEKFGYDLDPDRFDRPENWLDLFTFRRESRKDLILGAKQHGDAVRPNLAWTWNHSGMFSDNPELDAHATFIACEAHPPRYFGTIATAKWMQSSGKPFEFWMPEGIGSWGDWTITTEGTLKGMCAVALAHGGSIAFNHVAPPCGDYAGRVFPGVYDMLKQVMDWIKEREDLCISRSSVPVVGLLYSDNTRAIQEAAVLEKQNSPDKNYTIPDYALDYTNYMTAQKLLAECHLVHDFIYNENYLDRLEEYEAVVLPNTAFVDDKSADRIREYVAAGGNVLATYTTSLSDSTSRQRDNFLLADLFGADFSEWSPYSVAYIDRFREGFGEKLPDLPILVKDTGYQQNPVHKVIYCNLRPGARALAFFTEPVLESDWKAGRHIYHDHAPAGKRTDRPAVIINSFGKGKCVFMPFPIIQTYDFRPAPWQRTMILDAFSTMGVPGKIQLDAPYAIHASAVTDEEGWLIHLVRLQQETGSMFLDTTSPSGRVTCTIRPPWETQGVENALTGEVLDYSRSGEALSFIVPQVTDHEIIRVRRE